MGDAAVVTKSRPAESDSEPPTVQNRLFRLTSLPADPTRPSYTNAWSRFRSPLRAMRSAVPVVLNAGRVIEPPAFRATSGPIDVSMAPLVRWILQVGQSRVPGVPVVMRTWPGSVTFIVIDP